MLTPSSIQKDEKRLKEESSCQAQVYSHVFYLSLEYRSSYYKEGCYMMILAEPKCSKPREILRVIKRNQISRVCWNLTYRSDRLDLSQSKSGPLDLSGPFTRFQRLFSDLSGLRPDMFGNLFDRWNLNSTGIVRPFSRHARVLNQFCQFREFPSESALSMFGVTLPVWPICSDNSNG
jgi:hypothetical protein